MGMTMTQKILARHRRPGACCDRRPAGGGQARHRAGQRYHHPGGHQRVRTRRVLTQVFDREKIALVLDHYTPCKDIKAAQLCAQQCREFAKRL